MEKEPTKHQRHKTEQPQVSEDQGTRFLLNVINATIYSSGDDYEGSLEEFFPQIQALGHMIGASSIDEVSSFLRNRSNW